VVPKADSHVLLETVAPGEEAYRRTDQARRVQATGDSDRVKQEGLLASCEDLFNERRPIECISHEAGAYVTQNTVDQDSPSGYGPMISANRPVRTRTPGGVGAGG